MQFDFILASHLPAHCDPYVEAADHVTYGQNLTFNRFAGVLPRQDTGAYLVPDPARAVPRAEEPHELPPEEPMASTGL